MFFYLTGESIILDAHFNNDIFPRLQGGSSETNKSLNVYLWRLKVNLSSAFIRPRQNKVNTLSRASQDRGSQIRGLDPSKAH